MNSYPFFLSAMLVWLIFAGISTAEKPEKEHVQAEVWVEKLEKSSFSQLMKDGGEYSWIEDKDIRDKLIGLKKELSNCKLKDEQSAIDHVDNLLIKDGKSSVFSKCELTHTDKQHFVWEVRFYSAITYPIGTPNVIYWITAKDGSLYSKWVAPVDPRIERVKKLNQGDQSDVDDLLDKCSDYLRDEPFKITPYLETAILLQEMPMEQRVQTLRQLASDPNKRHEQQLHVLCQMLFCNKDGTSVISPSVLGGASKFDRFPDRPEYYGPVVIYKGCPILISHGYRLGGMARPSSVIVESCIENKLWRESNYTMLSSDQQQRIIKGFLEAKEWKDLVAQFDDLSFFTKQAEDGTGQAATRPESKPEPGDKPQPEAEGRSR